MLIGMEQQELGRRIRRLREERRWSQAELGDLVGVTGRTVGNWERGESVPRNRLGALEKVFGVDLETGAPHVSDAVVRAIEESPLPRADRTELVAHYWRLLDGYQVRGEGRGA